LARRRWPDDPARARLETLVARARQLVYHSEGRRRSAVTFFTHTYWQRVTEAPVFLAASAVLLFGPMLIGGLWGLNDAPGAIRFVPREYASVAEHEPGDEGRSLPVGIKAAFSSAIFTNNVRVTFVAFAGGILLGLGTAAVLLFNGALLGAVGGLAIEAGNGARLVELVSPHGVLELTCIVVAGAAGLRMGWAVVEPGRIRRAEALLTEARVAVEIVLGTAPWLVLAGLVEGFITPGGIGFWPALLLGFGIGGAYWVLLWRLSRSFRPDDGASRGASRP
jgi:uncharacterized membrane protein SpoIIM required for sporulation